MKRLLLAVVALGASVAAVIPTAAMATHTPQVGEIRAWVGRDSLAGGFFRKNYMLRGIGKNVEVWVTTGFNAGPGGRPGTFGTEFLENKRVRGRGYDCRNDDPRVVTVTDEQVAYLVDQFDNNIYPKEAANFSVPPNRDGSKAGASVRNPPFHPTGPGQNIVVLVDNVRDENFYDYNTEKGFSYIAGFFSSTLNELFDRNIMSIDSFDWFHRTGATPPADAFRGCGNFRGTARPFLYEGTFAHEYQHLLHYYTDSGETLWINEGLSDFAQTLTGYVDANKKQGETGADSHIQAFLGWLTPAGFGAGGPENSLTEWGDQESQHEGGEILSDYGAAYTLMLLLSDRYGPAFMSTLHRDKAHGLTSLGNTLSANNAGKSAADVLHEWAAMVALDRILDEGRTLSGGAASTYTSKSQSSAINWDNPETNNSPGAPPNGSDYVRLQGADGKPLSASQITSLAFDGGSSLTPTPVEWVVQQSPPGHAGNAALYSGTDDNLDRAIAREVAVPSGNATLTFTSQWNLEDYWDFGFVQVSDDGGKTYKSVACTDTTTQTEAQARDTVKENVPGFTTDSGAWKTETCSLSAYAGKTVFLAFRLVTDSNTQGSSERVPPGWWIDDVNVGGTSLTDGSSLAGWRTFTQIVPVPVSGWYVQLVGWHTSDKSVPAFIGRIPLNASFDATLDAAALRAIIGDKADLVGAIITYDEPTEKITQEAPYKLTVNGAVQPGGA